MESKLTLGIVLTASTSKELSCPGSEEETETSLHYYAKQEVSKTRICSKPKNNTQKIISYKTNLSDISESNVVQVAPSICSSSKWSIPGLDNDFALNVSCKEWIIK
jgi:hypothetical protein